MRCTGSKAINVIRSRFLQLETRFCRSVHTQPGRRTLAPRDHASNSHAFVILRNNPTARSEDLIEKWVRGDATDANMSLLAHAAVTALLKNKEVRNGMYVVNSIRHSPYRGENKTHFLRGIPGKILDYQMLDFGRAVPARLSAHALIHWLVRYKLKQKAAELAEWMMMEGMRLRRRTFHAAVSQGLITDPVNTPIPPPPQFPTENLPDSPSVLILAHSLVEDACNRRAVRLIIEARKSGQHWSVLTFQTIVNACLYRGELIVSSLLFVFAVKEWDIRKRLKSRFTLNFSKKPKKKTVKETTAIVPASQSPEGLVDWQYLQSSDRRPGPEMMEPILLSINKNIDEATKCGQISSSLHASFQALANLAGVLDTRQLPFPQVASLIKTLYDTPQAELTVWVSINGVPQRMDAYTYFHFVLVRLIDDFPSHSHIHPPPNLRAKNALLHYSLRHRLSPTLANKVLEYIMRNPGNGRAHLGPDIGTYNILIRSGTLLRQNPLAAAAMEAVNSSQKSSQTAYKKVSQTRQQPIPSSAKFVKKSPLGRALHKFEEEEVKVYLPFEKSEVVPDSYTLSALISHHSSTSQHDVVLRLLFQLFPELGTVYRSQVHPWDVVNREKVMEKEVRATREMNAAIRRAASLGPHFFSTTLNALRKSGHTRLAERLWVLARKAQRMSWKDDSGVTPWILPIAAYTTMLQCYASEANKGLDLTRGNPVDNPTTLPEWFLDGPNLHRGGWARYMYKKDNTHREPGRYWPRKRAKELGLRIVLRMRRVAFVMYRQISMTEAQRATISTLKKPEPDERFFNAALQLFSKRPRLRVASLKQRPPAFDRRSFLKLVAAHKRNPTLKSRRWHWMFERVAMEMVEYGFSVPRGLRHAFLGRWNPGTKPVENERTPLQRVPFGWGKYTPGYQRKRLLTIKTKGLPIRKHRARIT